MASTTETAAPAPPQRTRGQRIARGVGWTLIGIGVLILLYLVYLLWFTGLFGDRAQGDLLDEFRLEIGAPDAALPGEGPDDGTAYDVDPGDAYAALWFERPGEGRIVHEETLYVVEGVSVADLRRGPGHYPETAAPGDDGNFAVSGHRTTYGAPFYDLDELEAGDEIHVVDRAHREWVYEVVEERIVAPTDVWVIGRDPIGLEGPMMTLTTCHPRFSARERLIVFAELVPGVAA